MLLKLKQKLSRHLALPQEEVHLELDLLPDLPLDLLLEVTALHRQDLNLNQVQVHFHAPEVLHFCGCACTVVDSLMCSFDGLFCTTEFAEALPVLWLLDSAGYVNLAANSV